MKDNLEIIFKERKREFDIAEPNIGHFERFEAKLKAQNKPKSRVVYWPWLAAAASVIIIFGIWFGGNFNPNKGLELADVSPKMEETQSFFVQTIQKEIALIEKNKTPKNQKIIDDAFLQLNKLEENYKKLTVQLKESSEDKRVIYAMIFNFQQRIEILQNLMQQLEDVEQIENQNEQII